MDKHPFDAIGEQIVIGNSYGYTTNTNGITRVVIGIAQGFTSSGLVRILITSSKKYYANIGYGDDQSSQKTNIRPYILFPVKK